MEKSVNRVLKGRPRGSKTKLHGLTEFCRVSGYSKTYAHEVLSGKRPGGAPVRRAWAWFLAEREKAEAQS